MSRIASDAVAMAVDQPILGPRTGPRPDWIQFKVAPPTRTKFQPYRLYGLAARLLARSNAVYDRIDYRDGGSFAEPHASRHAGWKP